jgi:hypothetical protein
VCEIEGLRFVPSQCFEHTTWEQDLLNFQQMSR